MKKIQYGGGTCVPGLSDIFVHCAAPSDINDNAKLTLSNSQERCEEPTDFFLQEWYDCVPNKKNDTGIPRCISDQNWLQVIFC